MDANGSLRTTPSAWRVLERVSPLDATWSLSAFDSAKELTALMESS